MLPTTYSRGLYSINEPSQGVILIHSCRYKNGQKYKRSKLFNSYYGNVDTTFINTIKFEIRAQPQAILSGRSRGHPVLTLQRILNYIISTLSPCCAPMGTKPDRKSRVVIFRVDLNQIKINEQLYFNYIYGCTDFTRRILQDQDTLFSRHDRQIT